MKLNLNRRRFFRISSAACAGGVFGLAGIKNGYSATANAEMAAPDISPHRYDLYGVPVIDFHTHIPKEKNEEDMKLRLAAMDNLNVRKTIILNSGPDSQKAAFQYLRFAPDRFVIFTGLNFENMDKPGWSETMVRKLEDDARLGARGLKMVLGKPRVQVDRMAMDDPRLDPVYAKAGELGFPIAYHSNDPEEFFYPPNRFNWWCGADYIKDKGYADRLNEYVSREELIRQQENMISKHPNTIFILVHMAFLSRQLALLADLLDRRPNVHLDLCAELGELGRSHKESADFMTYYQNRILFGTDGGVSLRTRESWESFIKQHFVVLESDHDNITPPFRRSWNIHGLNLPKEALEQIYYKNAEAMLSRPVKIPE